MPPRVRFLEMEEVRSGSGGWKSSYRIDRLDAREMMASNVELNGPYAGTYPCVLSIILHPDGREDYRNINLSDIHRIGIRMSEMPLKLRLYRNLNHCPNLPHRMMNLGNFAPQWVRQINDECEIVEVEVGFWTNGTRPFVAQQSIWPHHFWLPYLEFYNELPGQPGFFVDQPVAFYFYYDPNTPSTVIRNIDRNGHTVHY